MFNFVHCYCHCKQQNCTMSARSVSSHLLLSVIILLLVSQVDGFSTRPISSRQVPTSTILHEKPKNDSTDDPTMNPLTKSSWYAVELFGKVFGKGKSATSGMEAAGPQGYDLSKPPQSLKETLGRIKLDNDRSYFLSGQVDEEIYDPNCVFSDPFVSFEGRERFVTNLANLGSFITNYSARVLNYDEQDPTVVKTKVCCIASANFVSIF